MRQRLSLRVVETRRLGDDLRLTLVPAAGPTPATPATPATPEGA